jgi:hypothetical protein
MRLPFHLIMQTVSMLSDLDTVSHDYSDLYCGYLVLAGWTETEYEKALLDFIDKNWEAPLS